MNFKEEIIELENIDIQSTYIVKIGNNPIIFTAPHTMEQKREDGSIKKSEPFTKAIAMYVSLHTDCSYLIKLEDTGIDANSTKEEDFKTTLLNLIKSNNIKLVIDLHGAKEERDFDVEFGTLDDKTADKLTINQLEESFNLNDIKNIAYNNPFKGGGITQYIYGNSDIEIVQIEINKEYRDFNNIDKIEKICLSLIDFVNKYTK